MSQLKSVLPDKNHIIARETSKRAYENKPKTSDVCEKQKKTKNREIITLCTHTNIPLNPEMSLYLLLFLYVMILFCFSSRTSKQYDMQYKRKRNTLTTSPKTCNYIYKRLYRKTSPKSLMISGLGNCS